MWQHFCRKLHENERNWPGGVRVLPGSATVFWLSLKDLKVLNYRSGSVNSKSFVGKFLFQIK